MAIWQDLVSDHGFVGGYQAVAIGSQASSAAKSGSGGQPGISDHLQPGVLITIIPESRSRSPGIRTDRND
jgi:hypothetical protein